AFRLRLDNGPPSRLAAETEVAMGAWGTGLYSGDFAMDLRGTIRAVARLPFSADRLVDVLCDAEPGAARSSVDYDHTVFWLVVADQFAKRGIDSPRARETALSIIDEGRDRGAMAALGMPEPDLRRRDRMLAELRGSLVSAPPPKSRTTLKTAALFVRNRRRLCLSDLGRRQHQPVFRLARANA